jgi:hypothetical protein
MMYTTTTLAQPFQAKPQAPAQREGNVRIHTEHGIKTLSTPSDVRQAIKHWDAQLPAYLKPGTPEEKDAANKVLSAFTGKFRDAFHLDLKPHKSPIVAHNYYGDENHVATARFSFPQDPLGTKNTLPVVRTSVWDQLVEVATKVRDKTLHNTLINAPTPHPRESLVNHLEDSDFAKLPDAIKHNQREESKSIAKTKKTSTTKPMVKMDRALLEKLKKQDASSPSITEAATGESYLDEIKRKWNEKR